MTSDEKEMLEYHGWTIECESPLEIRHSDGSFATQCAATYVIDGLADIPPLREACQIKSFFKKKGGDVVYNRLSESAVKFLKLDERNVYGMNDKGNVTMLLSHDKVYDLKLVRHREE